MPIEVEARDLGEVREVLQLMAGDAAVRVDRIMLDNMAHLDPAAPSACRPGVGYRVLHVGSRPVVITQPCMPVPAMACLPPRRAGAPVACHKVK